MKGCVRGCEGCERGCVRGRESEESSCKITGDMYVVF